MASAAWPSILAVRGDGLPRFARSDGKNYTRSEREISDGEDAPTPSWRAQRGHPSWRCAVMDCRASLAVTEKITLAVTENSSLAETEQSAVRI
jgi:hypothetical protein